MANPSEIVNDPDFINANAATKQAIFAKHVASNPEFLNAPADAQQAIKLRFGFGAAESSAAPTPKPVVVKAVPMGGSAAPAVVPAPDPLVTAFKSMKAGAPVAAAAPAAAAPAVAAPMPRQPDESQKMYDLRMAKAREETDKAQREAAAPVKKRDLGSTDVERITKIDDSLGVQNRLTETFKPDYAGYKVKFAGDIANTMASTFGGDKEAQADWWKSYNANDTIARNALFGASLTEGEEKAWKATTVDISMTPSMIERRMKERAALIEAKRKTTVENLGKANFNVDNFQAAPSNFSPAPVAAPPVAALKEGHVTTFKNGQQWILKNGKPEKVN
jgi:hypothetical protein